MAIEYVGGQVVNAAGATGTFSQNFSLTGGLTSTPAANDLVLVAVSYGGSSDKNVVVSGYTEIADLYANDDNDNNFGLFYKFMTSTPDTSVTLPYSDSALEGSAYAISVWRGVDQTTPQDVTAVTATGTNTARPDPGAITPVTSGAIIIVAGGGSSQNGAANFTSSDLSNFLTTFGNDTYDSIVGLGSYAWTSGAFNPAAWAGATVNIADSWNAVTIALRPASSAASLLFNPIPFQHILVR